MASSTLVARSYSNGAGTCMNGSQNVVVANVVVGKQDALPAVPHVNRPKPSLRSRCPGLLFKPNTDLRCPESCSVHLWFAGSGSSVRTAAKGEGGSMRELLEGLDRWQAEGRRVAI